MCKCLGKNLISDEQAARIYERAYELGIRFFDTGRKDLWYLARAITKFRGQLFEGRKYRFINDVNTMTGFQVALRYVIDNPYISSALFSTATMSHLDENIKALDINIPKLVYERIKQVGSNR